MELPQRKIESDESVACDVCGRFGAVEFGERRLCADCYEASGSCCPEFGEDDLWAFNEEGKKDEIRS